jgi:HEAT repeat protein
MRSGLCRRENIEPVMQQYSQRGKDYLNETALPWFNFLGADALEPLMDMLSDEKDRRRRIQLMDVIRSYGSETLPKLVKTLSSDKWYLVRNALILIAEIADKSCFGDVAACMGHPDKRVKSAAIRALWRGFADLAEEPFLKAIGDAEPDIFEEILFGLAQIPAPNAVPIALGYAIDTNNPDRIRAMALDVLAKNPSHESLSVLTELARRKGLAGAAQPLSVRLAAAKAMAAAGREGIKNLSDIVNSEPWGAEKDQLARILEP